MAPTIDQSDRWLTIDSPFGADQLVLTAFDGEEALSELFSYRLELMSPDDALDADKILGKKVTFTVFRADADPRIFNGVVKSFHAGPKRTRGMRTYHAEVVPWTWFLSRTSDCKIFQEKTVKEIIEEVFGEYGLSDFEFKLSGSYTKHVYRVQYRETDLDFICRLMEEEGMFFYFTHEDGKHNMVIADSKSAYYDLPEAKVECHETEVPSGAITDFSHRYEFLSGKWTQQDYNFEKPKTDLETPEKTILKTPDLSKYEYYDYPGRYTEKGDGKALSKLRMEEEEAAYDVAGGNGTCRTFSPGGKFEISRHDIPAEVGQKYTLTSTSHAAADYTSIYPDAGPPSYSNSFTCIPDSVTYRHPRRTPRPVVRGPQTAVVVGPSGEEIECDKYGRIKVQFHWDRIGENNEKSSCWLRVAQLMAGAKWGAVFTPRIGMEVIVDFLEGDPDKPICTGTVYNADNMPPWELPANKTQSGFKSLSSKDGSASSNFNELRFEDKKGSEEIYLHAEKDMNTVVENNETHKVGFEKKDDGDQTIEVFNNQDVKIGCSDASDGSQTLEVWKDRTTTIKTGDETLTVEKGKREISVDTDDNILTVKKGDRTTKVSLGKDKLEAMQSIELKCGSSSIKLEPAKITIKSAMIDIKADTTLNAKGLMTTVKGDAMLTLKGGLTMIN